MNATGNSLDIKGHGEFTPSFVPPVLLQNDVIGLVPTLDKLEDPYSNSASLAFLAAKEILLLSQEFGEELLSSSAVKNYAKNLIDGSSPDASVVTLEALACSISGLKSPDMQLPCGKPIYKNEDRSPNVESLNPKSLIEFGKANCNLGALPNNTLGFLGRFAPSRAFGFKFKNGWALAVGVGTLVSQVTLALTQNGVLNDSPTGKAAFRSLKMEDFECIVSEQAHFCSGKMWNPSSSHPAITARMAGFASKAFMANDVPSRIPKVLPNVETFSRNMDGIFLPVDVRWLDKTSVVEKIQTFAPPVEKKNTANKSRSSLKKGVSVPSPQDINRIIANKAGWK